jgi:DNA-binding PadR family transcriptional regulator
MRREKDLYVKILQFIEENQTSCEPYVSDNMDIKGYTDVQIVYHLDLLNDEGLIRVEETYTMGNSWRRIERITNSGHDLLDSIKK